MTIHYLNISKIAVKIDGYILEAKKVKSFK